jgi:CHAT domain-containing protein
LYYGKRATVDSFLNELKSPHRILHLAGHLVVRQDNPLFSSVHFADGWLNYFDLADRRVDADLVVLSSCLSGPQTVAPGDELLGLQRAFMGSGVGSVVSSLWPVDDKATSELMSKFYSYYCRDGNVRASYNSAVRDQIAEYPHPFYWSSFLLFSRKP